MFITSLQFTAAELQRKQQEFDELTKTFDARILLWKELKSFFANKNFSDIQNFQFSYWKWYVDLSWRHMERMEAQDIVEDLFARQVPMAFLLKYDVLEKMLWYFGLRVFDLAEVESLYSKILRSFMVSEFPVGIFQGKPATVEALIEEIKLLNSRGNDSLEEASFRTKLNKLFSPSEQATGGYVFADPDDIVEKFIDLVNFFLGVKTNRIWYIVETFIHPQTYTIASSQPVSVSKNIGDKNEQGIGEDAEDGSVPADESINKPSYENIKNLLESEFPQDASGQFIDAEGVLGKLASYAEAYNDAMILDLYYYNEADGKFHWNDDLLNS